MHRVLAVCIVAGDGLIEERPVAQRAWPLLWAVRDSEIDDVCRGPNPGISGIVDWLGPSIGERRTCRSLPPQSFLPAPRSKSARTTRAAGRGASRSRRSPATA